MRGNPVFSSSFLGRRFPHRFGQFSATSLGSLKVKLLLSLCIAITTLLLPLIAAPSSLMGWRRSHRIHPSSCREGYTLLINTWKRNDLLKQSVHHYASCPGLDSIHIVWSEPDPPPDSLSDALRQSLKLRSRPGHEIDLRFDLNEDNSLNNRFKEMKDSKTDAIFSIDDDVVFPCSSVELAFSVWRSAPAAMVGFVPRAHWIHKSRDKTGNYRYGGWWSVWWTGSYSVVLSKAAFFHKKYLALYTNEMPASIRDYVTRNRNCEDIAMSFLVANVTSAPPIWVKGRIFEMGSTGISSLGGHSGRRTQCLNEFAALYGHMPLVSNNFKAIDSRHSWLW